MNQETLIWQKEALDFFVGESNMAKHIERNKYKSVIKRFNRVNQKKYQVCLITSEREPMCTYDSSNKSRRSLIIVESPTYSILEKSPLLCAVQDILVLIYNKGKEVKQKKDFHRRILENAGVFTLIHKGSTKGLTSQIIEKNSDNLQTTPFPLQLLTIPLLKTLSGIDRLICSNLSNLGETQYMVYIKN